MSKTLKMKPETSLPWAHLMRLGLGVLKLPPNQFWQTTLRELKCTIDGAMGKEEGKLMPRETFEKLMTMFPDTSKTTQDE